MSASEGTPAALARPTGGSDIRAALKLVRFVGVGLASTILYAALDLAFVRLGGMDPVAGSVSAYGLAAAFSYLAHRSVTFRSDRAHAVAVPQFLALTGFGLAVAAGSAAAVKALGLPFEAALIATCVGVPLLNFFVLDRVVFRARGADPTAPVDGF